jgi:hypothetical protein
MGRWEEVPNHKVSLISHPMVPVVIGDGRDGSCRWAEWSLVNNGDDGDDDIGEDVGKT